MDEERETGMGCMTLMVLAIVIALLAMCSCGSRKTITEYVAVHDTLIATHSDTVAVDKWHVRHDTLRIETERVVTLLQPSDKSLPAETVRVESNNYHWQHTADLNTETRFVSKVDSILRALDSRHDKQTVKTKIPTVYWLYGVFLLVCGIGCVWMLTHINIRK